MPTVRRISASESHALKAVRLRALSDSPGAFGMTFESEAAVTDTEWQSRAETGANASSNAIWVVEDQVGEPFLGMARLAPPDYPDNSHHLFELASMWIDASLRGSGIADLLVQAVITEARGIGQPSIGLWVHKSNVRAQRLYERNGFVPSGKAYVDAANPCSAEQYMIAPTEVVA